MVAAARTVDGRVGVIMVGALVAFSFLGALVLPDPNASDFSVPNAPDGGPALASGAHPLGVDALFRDELARLSAGGRVSLGVAATAAAIASALGVFVGVSSAVASKRGLGVIDQILMRAVDVLLALPFLLVVSVAGVMVGRTDAWTMTLVLGMTGWTGLARVVRSRALVVLEQDYVTAARAMGAGFAEVASRHVLPNVATTAVAMGTSLVGSMILAEAVLGYLAVGLPPPDASWGRMLHEAETFVVTRPVLVAAPVTCIVAAMLAFHRLGEGLRAVTGGRSTLWLARVPFPLDVALVVLALAAFLSMPRPSLARPEAVVDSAPPPARGGTLRLATAHSARTLDPAMASDEIAVAMGRMIFGRLVAFDELGASVPALAESVAWSSDGRTLRLQLRAGVVFHDGAVLTAADVKRSIERALDPRVPSPYASHLERIAGVQAFREKKAAGVSGIAIEGDRTVVFQLTEPDSTLPSLLSMPFMSPVCPSTPADATATSELALCGAGPFKIERFESEDGMSLARHDRYYEPGLPYLDRIEVSFRVPQQVQRYRFERGQLDLVRELVSSDASLFRSDPRWAPFMSVVENLRTSAIFLNTERPPFDNVALRRAVYLAIDPSVLSRLRPDVEPLATVVPPGVPGRPTTGPARKQDRAAALEAMREAGYPFDPATGHGGYPEPIEYVTVPESFEQYAAEVYQQQLAKVGIRVRLKLLGSQSYYATVQRRGQATMGWAGWQADYPDPLTFFDPNLVSSSIAEITQNYAFFADAELDAIVAEVRRETDPDKRAALFARAEERVAQAAPWVPTTSPRTLEVRQPWLHGYAPSALTALDFTRTYLGEVR